MDDTRSTSNIPQIFQAVLLVSLRTNMFTKVGLVPWFHQRHYFPLLDIMVKINTYYIFTEGSLSDAEETNIKREFKNRGCTWQSG